MAAGYEGQLPRNVSVRRARKFGRQKGEGQRERGRGRGGGEERSQRPTVKRLFILGRYLVTSQKAEVRQLVSTQKTSGSVMLFGQLYTPGRQGKHCRSRTRAAHSGCLSTPAATITTLARQMTSGPQMMPQPSDSPVPLLLPPPSSRCRRTEGLR